MKPKVISIRAFIGSKNFDESISFYKELGFEETKISNDMVFFNMESVGFYLQKYYVKRWIENSMLFLEVEDVSKFLIKIKALNLPSKYKKVKLSGIQENDWGREFFLHDPSGVLWHIGQFN